MDQNIARRYVLKARRTVAAMMPRDIGTGRNGHKLVAHQECSPFHDVKYLHMSVTCSANDQLFDPKSELFMPNMLDMKDNGSYTIHC